MMRTSVVCLFLLAAMVSAQDMPLSQVLIPGEGWRAVDPKLTVACITADGEGNLLIAGGKEAPIWLLTKGSLKVFAKKASVTRMCWSPKGYLLTLEKDAIYRRNDNGEVKKLLSEAKFPFDIAVSPTGDIYFTDIAPFPQNPGSRARICIYQVGGDGLPSLIEMEETAGMVFWRDGGTLVIGNPVAGALNAFRVGKDGGLDAEEEYYKLRTRRRSSSKVISLTLDADGRLYAATTEGVQVFDPTGRLCGVINAPARAAVTALAFAGPDRDLLYVVCGGKLYARKTKIKGFVPAKKAK